MPETVESVLPENSPDPELESPGTSPSNVADRRTVLRSVAALGLPATAMTLGTSGLGVQPAVAATPTLKGLYAPGVPKLRLTTSREWHVARRAAQAPSAALVNEITSMGINAWLDRQLRPELIDDGKVEGLVDRFFPWTKRTARSLVQEAGEPKAYTNAPQLMHALLIRPVFTRRVLLESVVECLADMVYAPIMGKGSLFISELDQLFRKHAFGRYADLLKAVIMHPAMILELDNYGSSKRYPNENLGRELLELYTVGVGNYSESDVLNASRILTGHTMSWVTQSYRYEPADHYTGPVKVQGFTHANSNPADGPQILRQFLEFLAKHQSTSERIARRLATRFVSDNPTTEFCDRLAKVYRDNDTRIAPVLKALFTDQEFYANAGRKWRRPLEYATTIMRAGGVSQFNPMGYHNHDVWNYGHLGWQVGGAGHLPRDWPGVEGYPDHAGYWGKSNAMLNAWNVALERVVATNDSEFDRPDWRKVTGIRAGMNAREAARKLTLQLTGYEWPDTDLTPVASVLFDQARTTIGNQATLSDKAINDNLNHAVRLVFASPYGFLR